MALTYVCSFDQYGPAAGTLTAAPRWGLDNEVMLGDGWSNLPEYNNTTARWEASGSIDIEEPSWGARQGDYALVANKPESRNSGGSGFTETLIRSSLHGTRLAIPGNTDVDRWGHIAFGMDSLPIARGHGYIVDFCDQNSEIRASLRVNSSGRIELVDGTDLATSSSGSDYSSEPIVLLTTAAPVVSPNTWYSLNWKITANPTDETCDFVLYVGAISAANKVMDGSGLAFSDKAVTPQPAGTENNIDIYSFLPAALTNLNVSDRDQNVRAIRDIVLYDDTGTYNNDFLGQVFVSAQEMRTEDSEGSNWSSHPRELFGDGILNAHENNTGIRMPDTADLEIGASNFTFETRIRWSSLPTLTGAKMMVLSKWDESSNRSYRLYYDADASALIWEVSTDGTTPTVVKTAAWEPLKDRWYDIAVSRITDTTQFTSIFVDGIEIGVRAADDNTYFNGTASLGIGADFASGSTPDSATAFDGYLDETRFTIGTGRYTTDYTPSATIFGRDVGGDSDFADVVLLMGYDGGSIADESSVGRTLTINAEPVTADQPGDGEFSYNVLNQRPTWDDTYIEAANLFATGIFTFTGLPVADETITIGSQTYTWKASFTGSPADEVIIGADIDESVSNIIAAINNGAGEGTVYGTGTTANTSATASIMASPEFALTSLTVGDAGNSVATTETMTDGEFLNATLTGGQDIPSPSDFAIERLPIDVAGVLGVQVTARALKTDAGDADIRMDFVGPSAGVATGDAQSVDLNASWQRQVFEEDPDTSASLTPSSIIGGRVRFTRTT